MTEEDNDDSKEIMGSTASLETVGSEDLSEVTEGSQPESNIQQDDYVNPRGVRFTPQEPVKEGMKISDTLWDINLEFFLQGCFSVKPWFIYKVVLTFQSVDEILKCTFK